MSMSKKVTEKEYETIKLLCERGLATKDIMQITGRSDDTIGRIRKGVWQQFKDDARKKREQAKEQKQMELQVTEPEQAEEPSEEQPKELEELKVTDYLQAILEKQYRTIAKIEELIQILK